MTDETDFNVLERKELLEKIEKVLNKKIDKVTYKNRMLYLNTKKSLVAFSFDTPIEYGDIVVEEKEYYLSRITIFDGGFNQITGFGREKEYTDVWKNIESKLINKYVEGLTKFKMPVDDVLKLLEE